MPSRSHIGALFVAAFLAAALAPAAARAELTICNKDDLPIRYAIVHMIGVLPPLIGVKWKAEGWYTLEPGCRKVLAGSVRQEAVLSLQTVWRHRTPTIKHYPLGKPVGGTSKAWSRPMEGFLCVKEGAFSRIQERFSDHEDNCPPGWYKQLFNLQVFVPPNTRFTLELN